MFPRKPRLAASDEKRGHNDGEYMREEWEAECSQHGMFSKLDVSYDWRITRTSGSWVRANVPL